jgi:hypothetical protein
MRLEQTRSSTAINPEGPIQGCHAIFPPVQ